MTRRAKCSFTLCIALMLAGSAGAAPKSRRSSSTRSRSTAAAPASQELAERLRRAELLAGVTEVEGPGVIVTLRHCPQKVSGADPSSLMVRDQDVNAVLSALRSAGAEALAISGKGTDLERILVTSAARDTDLGI